MNTLKKGTRIRIKGVGAPLDGTYGEIVGLATSKNIVTNYIIKPDTSIYSETYPYDFCCLFDSCFDVVE